MSFPWLDRTSPTKQGAAARLDAQLRDLRDRAALYFRLGFTAEAATRRLVAMVAWEHDPAPRRPDGLSDLAIAAVVKEMYTRRPSGTL